jgi:hypothetical protein
MKKVISLILAVAMLFTLFACGGKESESSTETSGAGTTSEQYTGGAGNSTDEQNNESVVSVQLGTAFTATDSANEVEILWNSIDFAQEVHSLVENTSNYARYIADIEGETFVIAKITLKNLGGDAISDSIFSNYYYSDYYQKNYYHEIVVTFSDKYNYEMAQLDTESTVMSAYWTLEPLKTQEVYFYASIPDELVTEPFYIKFSVGDSETIYQYSDDNIAAVKEDEDAIETAEPEEEPLSQEEETYQKATKAEECNYYASAWRLFSQIPDYEDSADHIANLESILTPYDGDYTINMFAGGSYNMSIQNGSVKALMNNVDGAQPLYYDLIGYEYTDGTIAIAMASTSDYNGSGEAKPEESYYKDISDLYSNSEVYIINVTDDGKFLIVASDKNSYKYMNGSNI